MSGVNKAIVIGYLGSDPEVRIVSSGNTVARLSVATSENWTDREGQKQERTEWHRVVVWGKQAEICGKYLAKGRQVYVEGRLQTRSWEDAQGQKKYTTEVVANNIQFLGPQGQEASSGQNFNQRSSSGGGSSSLSNDENSSSQSPSSSFSTSGSTSSGSDSATFNKNEEIPF